MPPCIEVNSSESFEYKLLQSNQPDLDIARTLFNLKDNFYSESSQVVSGSLEDGLKNQLMIDHDELELGSKFAVSFEMDDSQVNPPHNDISVSTYLDPGTKNIEKKIELTESSTIFYDSALKFKFTDGILNNDVASVTKDDVTVVFDTTNEDAYNVFKSVNSSHGNGGAGLKVSDHPNSDALMFEGTVIRQTTGELTYTPHIDSSKKLNVNGYEDPAFNESGDLFVGAIQMVQDPKTIVVSGTVTVDENDTTLVDSNGNTIGDTITEGEFDGLFPGATYPFEFKIVGNEGGGYSVDNDDVVTVDDGSLNRNLEYMGIFVNGEATTHQLTVTNGSYDFDSSNSNIQLQDQNEFLGENFYTNLGNILINSGHRVGVAVVDGYKGTQPSLNVVYDTDVGVSSALVESYYNAELPTITSECLLGNTKQTDNWDGWYMTDDSIINSSVIQHTLSRAISDDDKVLFLHVSQYKNLAEESGILDVGNNTVANAFVEVDVEDVNLNEAPYNAIDLRVQLNAKTLLDYGSVNNSVNPLKFVCDDTFLKSSKQELNLMGDKVYSYIQDDFEFKHTYFTTEEPRSVDTMSRKVKIEFSNIDNEIKTVILNEEDLTFIDPETQEGVDVSMIELPASPTNLVVHGTPITISGVDCEVYKIEKTITYDMKHKLNFGPYHNLYGKIGGITEKTVRYALWHPNKLRWMPDHHLIAKKFFPSRVFESTSSVFETASSILSTFDMPKESLYGFKVELQKYVNDVWVTVKDGEADLMFDQKTVFEVEENGVTNGKMTIITDFPKSMVLDDKYFVQLTNKEGVGINSILKGKEFSSSELLNLDLNELHDLIDYQDLIPNLTTTITHSPSLSNRQSIVTFDLYEGQGDDKIKIGSIVSNETIIKSFVIIKNNTSKFKVTESLNDVPTYVNGNTSVVLVQGATMNFEDVTMKRGNEVKFTLKADRVTATLYNDYIGTYSTEEDANITKRITDNNENNRKAREFVLKRYRGIGNNVSFQRTRSTIQFQIVNNSTDVKYSDISTDLYVGKDYTINDLKEKDSSSVMDLGLKFTGNVSMLGVSEDTLTIPVYVDFGSYDISITNGEVVQKMTNSVVIYDNGILNFNASRVKVNPNETYVIDASIPNLKIYKSGDFMDPSDLGSLSEEVSHVSLLDGHTISGTSIYIKRDKTPSSHTLFINAPPPQFTVEARKVNGETEIVFMDYALSEHYEPVIHNYRPFVDKNDLNNLEVRFVSIAFNDKRDSSNDQVVLDIAPNKLLLTLNPMTSSGDTIVAYKKIIFNGPVNEFNFQDRPHSYEDDVVTLKTNASYNITTGLVSNIKVATQFTPNATSEDNTHYNLLFGGVHGGVHVFALGEYDLKMQPGNSVYVSVYGNSYSYDVEAKKLKLTLIRYSTDVGIDFDPNGYDGEMLRSFVPVVTKRETMEFSFSHDNNLADNVAFSFENIIQAKLLDLSNLVSPPSWITTPFTSRNLDLGLVALNKLGKNKLRKLFSVNEQNPRNVLLCHHPDVMKVKGADGSVRFRINAHGSLTSISQTTSLLNLVTVPTYGNSTIDELFKYNITGYGSL